MSLLLFVIVYPLVWLLSSLPMRLLYLLSDFLYILIYYVFGYRKKVVFENIGLSFPELSASERTQMVKKFYHHFLDLMVESIKAFTISKKEIQKRYVYKNPELVNKYAAEGKSIAMVGAHLANWEWSIAMALSVKINCFGAYTRLGNKYFDRVMLKTRQRFGFIGYPTTNTIKNMQKNFADGVQGLYLLLSDQSPQLPKTFFWHEFLGVKVPIHTGAESLAKRFDMVVINYHITKVKRGHFEVEFELVTDKPQEFEDYKITEKYLKITERNIKLQPECYLWSHRRFKHRNAYKEWEENFAAKNKTKK